MGRIPRIDVGDVVYHVLNRANFRFALFKKDQHYQSFLDILEEATAVTPMRILAYCLMPNHWHTVLYPKEDCDLSAFMQWVTLTHTQRYHAKTGTIGYGHIYQGRYKSFPVQQDNHYLTLIRYVERNAKRAAFVEKAEDWQWSSAYARVYGNEKQKNILSPWPVEEPSDYLQWLNQSQPKEEIENIRYALKKSRPYGSDRWVSRTVRQFGLENTLRDPGRPRNS